MIRMSQWAKIRHQHLTQGVARRELARRFAVDIKTVRRALASEEPPVVPTCNRAQGSAPCSRFHRH